MFFSLFEQALGQTSFWTNLNLSTSLNKSLCGIDLRGPPPNTNDSLKFHWSLRTTNIVKEAKEKIMRVATWNVQRMSLGTRNKHKA